MINQENDNSRKMINQLDSLEKHLRSSPAATWPACATFVLPTPSVVNKIDIRKIMDR